MSEQILTKQCPRCKQTFPRTIEYFNKRKTKPGGLRYWCKQCESQSGKHYIKNHKAERLQYKKKYRKTIRGYLSIVWVNMLQRCNNLKNPAYKNYGGRGIENKFACFEDFFNYVVKELNVDPRNLTIDRIDNNGHYEPGNIHFISQAENNRNRNAITVR